ncbi:MAG: phosphate signaling complex protein PhoU [Planctomycetota bacterium]|nr:phosphate signaling complex protein PhoU [Planctomycetota bacterium]
MHRRFDDELNALKEKLVRMGTTAQTMTHLAIRALVERDEKYCQDVFRHEETVNELNIVIDEAVLKLIALRQPVAGDLRFLVMSTKIGSELERIADQAVNICQNTHFLLQYPLLKPLIVTPLMADVVEGMVRDGLDSFVRRDAALARQVLETDDKVDAFKDQIFRELLTYMMSDPDTVHRALALILISRNLERIGDHATNIAEDVIYVVGGKDVRHHHEEKKRG